jgi:restriction endonuclease Mrr
VPNPEEFFRHQFGGDRFVEIFGELSLGREFKEACKADKRENGASQSDLTAIKEEQQKAQEERIMKLTANLVQKLDKFTLVASSASDPTELMRFRSIISKEAEELKEESYGVELLHAIGYVYQSKARQFLSKNELFGVGRFLRSCQEKGHILSETLSTFKSVIDMQKSFEQLQKASEKELKPEEVAELEAKAAAEGLNTIWKGSKLEIESILREVCDRTLEDPNVSDEQRKRRAVALRVIGEVYLLVKPDSPTE